jgi:hypothetical protein
MRSGPTKQLGISWLWIGHALVIALALRALVPTGYMPIFPGSKEGGLKIVICTGSGFKTIALDPDGNSPEPASNQHQTDCVFAGPHTWTGSEPGAWTIGFPKFLSSDVPFSIQVPQVPIRRTGPAFGSRAPPKAVSLSAA